MEFLPTEKEVIALLQKTGALRDGHFGWPSGLHTDRHLETALVMRSYSYAKLLCVGLSRLLRGITELRALIPELSIVAATPAGLPVACCLAEALRVKQVYWAEKEGPGGALTFRQFMEPRRGDRVVLVDDILRSGLLLEDARLLLEGYGAEVLALAVLLHQAAPDTHDFSPLPLYYLARIEAEYYPDPDSCPLCRRGIPIQCIGVEPADRGRPLPCRSAAN